MKVKGKIKRSPVYMALSIFFIYIGIILCAYSIISIGIREYKLISSSILCCFSIVSFLHGIREILEGSYKSLGYLSLIIGPLALIFAVWSILVYI